MAPQIGIDYTSALHQTAGIGRYTREMTAALAALSSQPDYRLFVAATSHAALPPPPGPNFRWCPTRLSERWLARLWYRLRLPLWIEAWTGRLDLFHAPDFFLPPTRYGLPTLLTIHDLSFLREPETVMPGMAGPLRERVPRAIQRATHIIAVSEATRRDLIELYHTPPEKISVLYHGVAPYFQPVEEPAHLAAVRHKYHLGERPFILSVGTLQPRKNYQRLIQAMAQLEGGELALVIVGGRGWLYEEVFKEVARQGLKERVHFPGFVAEADLPALYSAATLFVYPSLYEGFGLPLLEAMACGVPAVAANQSALPELVGDAGLLVDPRRVEDIAAAIAQLWANAPLRQELARRGQLRAAQFTWPAMAGQLLALYQAMLDSRNSERGEKHESSI